MTVPRSWTHRLAAVACGVCGALLLCTSEAWAQAELAGSGVSGVAGTSVDLAFSFDPRSSSVSGLQFDIVVPNALSYVSTLAGPAASSANKIVSGTARSNGARIIIYGLNTNLIGSGVVAVVRLGIAASALPGSLIASISGLVATTPEGQQVVPTPIALPGSVTITPPPSVCGDLSCDDDSEDCASCPDDCGACEEFLYDTGSANLAPPTILITPDSTECTVFVGNNDGGVVAVDSSDGQTQNPPSELGDAVQGRSPVGTLPGDSTPTLFASTAGGIGYGVHADTGAVRWQTDANAAAPGVQPLGDALVASPTVSGSDNLAFFATRNIGGAENRVFGFDAKTGACRFVFNGDCNGTTGSEQLGQISGSLIYDSAAQRLYFTSTSLSGGATAWAVSVATSAAVWKRNLGDSDTSPAFGELARTSLYVGTNAGRIYHLQSSTGESCWSSGGSGCGDFAGEEQVFCIATGTRTATTSCTSGAPVTTAFYTLWSGTHAGRIVFATADGHLRMIDGSGLLIWKTTVPIAGASFPVVLPDINRVYVGSTDGHLHELDLNTGGQTNLQRVGDGASTVGAPVYHYAAQTLYVGSTDGKLYRYTVPF